MSVRMSNYSEWLVWGVLMPEPWDCRLLGWSKTKMIWGWNGWKPHSFCMGGTARGTNPANMARAQVQWLNWLNSLWNRISYSGFMRVPELSCAAFPYPVTLFQRFLFKASWRVLVDDDSSSTYDPVQSSCYAARLFLFSFCCSSMQVFFFFFYCAHMQLKIEHLSFLWCA